MIAALLYIMKINLNNELVMLRSTAAMPIYKILSIIAAVSFVFGILYIFAFNPLNAYMLKKYENFEAKTLKGKPSMFVLSKTGLWFKEDVNDNMVKIINAMRISQIASQAFDVEIHTYNKITKKIENISAESVDIKGDKWIMHNVEVVDSNFNRKNYETLELPITIDFVKLKNSMAHPNTISLWALPNFIAISKQSGLSTIMHELHFFSLLYMPLYFAVMSYLGGIFAFSSVRYGSLYRNVVLGLGFGFIVYFLTNIIRAFGIVTRFPVFLTTLLPVVLIMILVLYLIVIFEEKSL